MRGAVLLRMNKLADTGLPQSEPNIGAERFLTTEFRITYVYMLNKRGDRSAGKQKEKHNDKISLKLLPVLDAATSFSRVQHVKAKPIIQTDPLL